MMNLIYNRSAGVSWISDAGEFVSLKRCFTPRTEFSRDFSKTMVRIDADDDCRVSWLSTRISLSVFSELVRSLFEATRVVLFRVGACVGKAQQ